MVKISFEFIQNIILKQPPLKLEEFVVAVDRWTLYYIQFDNKPTNRYMK